MTPVKFYQWLLDKGYNYTYAKENYMRLLDLIDLGIPLDENTVRGKFWHKHSRVRRSYVSAVRKYNEFIKEVLLDS